MNIAFEGDTFIAKELIKLRDRFGLTHCIETGTQYGSTTIELCAIFENVTTIEADQFYFFEAIVRLSGLINAKVCFGRSEKLLKMPDVVKNSDNVLYYLDAHGDRIGGCPLKEELEIIASKGHKNVCIAIHDFKNPNHPDFGFDTFDYELCYEEIESYLKNIYKDGFDYHYNEEADGARQGIIFIYPKKQNTMGYKKTLTEIFAEIGNFSGIDSGENDKNSTHTYTETYDKLFAPFRDGCTFMEIGLALGNSIKLVDRYFENSKIIGVDLSIVFQPPIEGYRNDVTLIEADATKPEFLEKIKDYTFDLVNDDASHMTDQQIATFNLLKHKMKKGSIYCIEDLLSLDTERDRYIALHENVEIIDMRHINNRFDNALVIIRF